MQKTCSRDGRPVRWTIAMALLAVVLSGRSAIAYTPKDPQVLAAAGRAIKFLESPAARDAHSIKLGAKALVGMAILKHAAALSDLDTAESPSGGGNDAQRDGGKKHPKVVEAADAIQKYLKSTGLDAGKVYCDIYSTGLSAIFLIELDSDLYAPEIQCLMDSLKVRQKPHGG